MTAMIAPFPTGIAVFLTRYRCALLAAYLPCHMAAAQEVPVSLSCPVMQMGQPCPGTGLASAGSTEPEINLGLDNPVNLASGRKYLRDTDLPAHPGTPGLELVRHYNSADPRQDGTLGAGWRFSYDVRLYPRPASIQVIQADGSRVIFHCKTVSAAPRPRLGTNTNTEIILSPANGSDQGKGKDASCQDNSHGQLQIAAEGWRWRWQDGTALDFRQDGWLTRIYLPNGQLLARIVRAGDAHTPYSNNGSPKHAGTHARLLSVHGQQASPALVFHYRQGHGDITLLDSVETPAGRFRYTHENLRGAQQLTRVERPDGMQRHYAYDPAWQHGHGNAITGTGLAFPGQKPVWQRRWRYDAVGRVQHVEHLNAQGLPTSRWQLEYAGAPSKGQTGLTRILGPHGSTEARYITRAGRHRLVSIQGAPCPGCPAPGLSANYDAAGHLASVNGVHLTRHPNGSLSSLSTQQGGWPGLALVFQADGSLASWASDTTGTTRIQHHHISPALQRKEIHYANGDRWLATYDAAGHPLGLSATRNNEAAALQTQLDWQAHRLVRIEHPHETEWRQYDDGGRLVARRIQRPGAKPDDTPELALDERYDYDPDGKLIRHHLPEGGMLAYAWRNGRLTALDWLDHEGKRHRILGSCPGMETPAGTPPTCLPGQYGYVQGNGAVTTSLVHAGRLRYLHTALPDAPQPLLAQRLQYDQFGRLVNERVQTGDWQHTLRYGHDQAGRLAIEDNDKSGRRLRAWLPDGHLAAAAYSASKFMATPTWPNPAPIHTPVLPAIERDASGLPRQYGPWMLQYDAQRRLALARHTTDDVRISFRHNAHGHRIRVDDGSTITHYLHDGGQRTASATLHDGANQARIQERYLFAGQLPVAWIRYDSDGQGKLYFLHADAQGLPRAVSNTSGALVWRGEFDAFGQLLWEHGVPRPAVRYPGQSADGLLPWYDNGQRNYDPATGAYLEPDPLGPRPGHDTYGYAAQRPRQYADPTGMLLYAFDGTRNKPASLTNVWLLHELYQGGSRYIAGPGAASKYDYWDAAFASSAQAIASTQWERLLADLAYAGRLQRLQQENSIAIDLIGYSRGAALAQHFANTLATHVRNSRFWAYSATLGTVSACVDLRFMGLFDTVAQFGLNGLDNNDYQLGASAAWQWVAHAIALNEQRHLFPVNSQDQGQANLVEMPFIGAHADIGGGYLSQDTDASERGDLSDVALAWMHGQALAAGVPLAPLKEEQAKATRPLLHDERDLFMKKMADDRAVHHANGSAWLGTQAQHETLGTSTRTEVEAFIQRLPDWITAHGSVVGTVDMAGYTAWLSQQAVAKP